MTIVEVRTGFAQSGSIGVLKPGASLVNVSERLWPPQDGEYFPARRRKKNEPRNLRYGDVRLQVCCDVLRAVALSTGTGSLDIPTGAPGETREISSAVTLAELRQAFSAAGVCATERSWPEPADQLTLVVRHPLAEVQFTFRKVYQNDSEGSSTTLHSAIARDTHHGCR